MSAWPERLKVQADVKLANHTSWLIGGHAELFAEPQSINELKELQALATQHNLPVHILGGGTNVLVSDNGVRGLVISLRSLSGIEIIAENPRLRFWALAGSNKSELLKIFLKYKLAPARFLAGLPGQVGGGVVMNAGIGEKLAPREFVSITEAVEVLRPDGTLEITAAEKLNWSYRHCEGWRPGIITRVLIAYENQPDAEVLNDVRKLNQSRLQKQPLEWPSCGSVFQNPPADANVNLGLDTTLPMTAGRLIENVGLKGHVIGGAQVSEKHANFIVNKKEASAKDVKDLMALCVQRVKEKYNLELHSEVVWLGEPL